MKFGIACSANMKRILAEILRPRNITIDEKADVVLTEKGHENSQGKVSIVFEYNTLEKLIDFLDGYIKKSDSFSEMIIGKKEDGYELIQYEKVLYFEASGNFTYCKTYSGQYKIKEKLYELDQNLCEYGFIRIAKPYIVNILNVTEVIPWFGGRLLLRFKDTDLELQVARSYVKSFKEYLGL